MAEKKKILYIVEAMGGGVFTYIVDLANELVNKYDMYIAYRLLCYAYALSYKPLMNNMNRWYEYQVKCCRFLDRFGIRWIANAIVCVVAVYMVCTIIDMLRIRFVEGPVLKYLEKELTINERKS